MVSDTDLLNNELEENRRLQARVAELEEINGQIAESNAEHTAMMRRDFEGRIADIKAAQIPRLMSEAPRDTRGIAMLVRVAFREWDTHGVRGFVSSDGRQFVHENDLGLGANGRPLHNECILGWLPLPDREESKAEPVREGGECDQIKTLLGRVGVQYGRDGWYTLRVDGRSVALFASRGEAAVFSEMRCEHALLVTEIERELAEMTKNRDDMFEALERFKSERMDDILGGI